jgi:predicted component of type VI protein secretion system
MPLIFCREESKTASGQQAVRVALKHYKHVFCFVYGYGLSSLNIMQEHFSKNTIKHKIKIRIWHPQSTERRHEIPE